MCGLEGLNLVGMDVVEVVLVYDYVEIIVIVVVMIVYDWFCLVVCGCES